MFAGVVRSRILTLFLAPLLVCLSLSAPAHAQCGPSGTVCADDNNPCTTDLCNDAGTCVHAAGNAGAFCRFGSAGSCAPRTVPAGALPFPVAISKWWFQSHYCGANSHVRLYPTGQQSGETVYNSDSCAGWHTYMDYPPSASVLRGILDGLRLGTYTSPSSEAGVTQFNFTGGAITTAFTKMVSLYNARKDANGRWTFLLPVYDAFDCSTPSGPINIVGFATATITSVSTTQSTIDANVECSFTAVGETGGPNYLTLVSPCTSCEVAESCDGTSPTCPADVKVAAGTACPADSQICTNDVCDGAGTCSHPAGNTGTVCRPSTGICDSAEACDGSSSTCPGDGFAATSVVCRSAVDVCDAAETCTGASVACPADGFVATAAVCRAAAAVCDAEEHCTGSGSACPADAFAASTTVCRASAGICDVQETCSGGSTCPADGFASTGTICRSPAGACDDAESCTGNAALCPDDSFTDAATVCRQALGVCDVHETCTGVGPACPADALAASSTVCRSSAGICDTEERCSGAAVDCPADAHVATGTICRASAGVCDPAEACTGTGSGCPANGFASSTAVCRAAAATCDLQENCPGSGPACPADAKQPAGTVCATDNEVCTSDQCDSSGVCAHTSNSAACNDGLFCNGSDTCSQGTCSLHSGDPCAGPDGDGNCAESCDEAANGCAASDPDGTLCNDGDPSTVLDQCGSGLCNGTFVPTCGDADGICPQDCSIEADEDCSVCVSRSIAMTGCELKVTRRRTADRTDRMSIRCEIDACDAAGGILPSGEGIELLLADAAGPCFRDRLAGQECVQTSTGYRCSPADGAHPGIHVLKLKARSACEYSLRAKLTGSDLTCLDAARSPWVPTVILGDDCGDIGCPMSGADKASCPGTCGNGDASDAGEQCDGSDDSICPGLCDSTCTCR